MATLKETDTRTTNNSATTTAALNSADQCRPALTLNKTASVADSNGNTILGDPGDVVTYTFEVTNTGKREGATVIQMYVQDVTASMSRPVKQLRGFEKVNLKPGETQTISFPIDVEALKFWNQQMKYDAEPGKFNVFIGVDSARVNKGEFELL